MKRQKNLLNQNKVEIMVKKIWISLASVIFFLILFSGISYGFEINPSSEWWNITYNYRLALNVSAGSVNRSNSPIEMDLNFTSILGSGEFDNKSIRVIEYNSSGYMLGERTSQFDKGGNYNASSNAVGTIMWLLNGSTENDTQRYFYVYFDKTENTEKENPNYSTDLEYNWDGEEISVNNSEMEWKIDTNRDDNTSGIYYAKFKDSITLFDIASTARTAEYCGYNNGSDTGFDLINNLTIVSSGPVRLIFQQTGNETVFGSAEQTGQAKITKKYTFYEGNSWVKIDQNISNFLQTNITRSSDYPYPLTVDTGRILSGGATLTQPTSWSNDPYTSVFAGSVSGTGGMGLLNYVENNTQSYKAWPDIVNDAIGIKLTSFSFSDWIREVAMLFFSDSDSLGKFDLFRNRTKEPLSKTQGSAEVYHVNINTSADRNFYNRQENATITVEIVSDLHSLASTVNTTLNNGTASISDDITLRLYDDGTHGDQSSEDNIYTSNYTFSSAANLGEWNATGIVYDQYGQEINRTVYSFNVTNEYNLNLTITNPFGETERLVLAEVALKNYREDAYINGSALTCYYNGTEVTNKTDNLDGTFSLNFTAPDVIATYVLTCNATKDGNIGEESDPFYTETPSTSLFIDFAPGSFSIGNITQDCGYAINLTATVQNPGDGTGYSANITISKPPAWTINSSSESCGNIGPSSSCAKHFRLTIPKGASPENYTINATVNWKNLDESVNSTIDITTVNISSNPVMNVSIANITDTINEGHYKIFNFTLNSTGNDQLLNISFTASGLPSEWIINFTPASNSTIPAGSIQSYSANIYMPEGYTNGSYTGTIEVGVDNIDNKTIDVNITVPVTETWGLSATSCQSTVLINSSGTFCTIIVSNTGNQILNFTASPTATANFTYVNETNFSANPNTQHSFFILYETNGTLTTLTRNYNLSTSNGSQIIYTTITTSHGPAINITSVLPNSTEQLSAILINATIIDRTEIGLKTIVLNVTKPNGTIDSYNMTYLRNYSWTHYYSAYYPGDSGQTTQRGLYEVKVIATDNSDAEQSTTGNFTIYQNLSINASTLSSEYYQCNSGRINYVADDIDGNPISNVNVTFEIKDPNGKIIWNNNNQTKITDINGTLRPLPWFTITCDDILGQYTFFAHSVYNDTESNVIINKTKNYTFNVLRSFQANILSSSSVKKNNTIDFIITVLDSNNQLLDADEMNFTIYDPSNNEYSTASLSDMTSIKTGIYHYPKNMPIDATEGSYFAVLNATKDNSSIITTSVFSVSKLDIHAEIDTVPLWYASNTARFFVSVYDSDQRLINADSINLTLYDPDLNTISVTFTINQFSAGVYYATWTIPDSPTTGQYLITVNVTVNGSSTKDIATFRILQGGPFRFEIDAPTSSNIGEEMTFVVNATNEGDGPSESQFTCWIDVNGIKQSQIAWTKLIAGGENYLVNKDILVPSGLSEGAYILNCQMHILNSSFGDIYAQDTFSAVAAPSPVTPEAPTGAGGGVSIGPSIVVAANISIDLLKIYPSSIQTEKASTTYVIALIKNSGTLDLNNITAKIDGIGDDWYSVTQKIDKLDSGDTSFMLIEIHIPSGAEVKTYSTIVSVFSGEGVKDSEILNIEVYSSRSELLFAQIEQLKKDKTDLELKAIQLQAEGMDVFVVLNLLGEVDSLIDEAQLYLKNGNYIDAMKTITSARNRFNNAVYTLANVMKDSPTILEVIIPRGITLLLCVIIVVFVFLVALIVYKIFFIKEPIFKRKKSEEYIKEYSKVGELKTAVKKLKGTPAYSRVGELKAAIGNLRENMKKKSSKPKNEIDKAKKEIEKINAKKAVKQNKEKQTFIESLRKKEKEAERMLNILREQYDGGLLSRNSFNEMRRYNEKVLEKIKNQVSDMIKSDNATEQLNITPDKKYLDAFLKVIEKQYEEGVIDKEKFEELKRKIEERF